MENVVYSLCHLNGFSMSRITTPEEAMFLANERLRMEQIGKALDSLAQKAATEAELRSSIQAMDGIVGRIYKDPDTGWYGSARVDGYDLYFSAS